MENLRSCYQESNSTTQINQLLKQGNKIIYLSDLSGSMRAFQCAAYFCKYPQSFIVMLPEKEEAAYFYNDLCQILDSKHTLYFPSSFKRSPWDVHEDVDQLILRTETLNALANNHSQIVVTYPEAMIEKIIVQDQWDKLCVTIHQYEELSIGFLHELFTDYGFEMVDFVYEPGQFAIRGGIVDIYSFSFPAPYRIDFFGNKVDSIRSFDTESQLSLELFSEIIITSNLYQAGLAGNTCSIFNCLPTTTLFWTSPPERILEQVEHLHLQMITHEVDDDVKNRSLGVAEFSEDFFKFPRLYFNAKGNPQYLFSSSIQPVFHKNFDLIANKLKELQTEKYKLYIFSENVKQIERLQQIFEDRGDKITFIPIIKAIHEGFIDHQEKIACFTDHQIFGRYHKYHLHTDQNKKGKATYSLKEINQLNPGDYVVHTDHGIGKFAGLVKMESPNGKLQEVIKLIYKNNDQLFVSIHSLHRISKYKSSDGLEPNISKLGSGAWQKLKERTKSRVKDIAEDLIRLYAKRLEEKGFSFSPDTYMQQELEASFMYEDTPDQLSTTMAVKQDMERDIPMDRLVCGDVGFGKTEIAIRAAFKAVADNKQVAILVPTTILALQHYNTFKKRLKDFPCTVDYVSRLRTSMQIKNCLKNLENGSLNIIIGTHRLVGKDVKFHDLGLLIIDEEQKFGVSVKEKLKELKVNVDTLTLTATPIPRTLQFSLMGARDLSVINTPPPNRYPIQTELHTFSTSVVADAINFEIERNGQVFFIHNKIQNIYDIEAMIQRAVPKARTLVGHGQMDGKQLEQVMFDFINGDFDVLIATTIIESGLDIPNANTIIINHAQNFGLSELHQLRGRVGRSNQKAFCYLFAPPFYSLSEDAKKRLIAIENFAALGSGINIALQDLDIRGAGNMLGGEQSGYIADIGIETYQKILNEAVHELKSTTFKGLFKQDEKEQLQATFATDCVLESDLELLIPTHYIENIAERVNLYRELDNIKELTELEGFTQRIKDRFGELPQELYQLMNAVRLRRLAMELGIEKLVLKQGQLFAYFISNTKSPFYDSSLFIQIMNYLNNHPRKAVLKQSNQKLSMTVKEITSVDQALHFLNAILIEA